MEKIINIRKATPNDAGDIAKIRVKTWQVAYRGLLPDSLLDQFDLEKETNSKAETINNTPSWAGFYVAEYDGKVVGFSRIDVVLKNQITEEYLKNTAELFALYVLPEYQGKGIGYALMNSAKLTFLTQDFKRFVLWCLDTNTNSRKFYERQGGVLIGEMEKALRGTQQKEVCYLYDLQA